MAQRSEPVDAAMDLDPQEIRRLLDKEAIREVLLRYARGIDRHDDDLMASAYHPDAIDDHGAYIGDPQGLIRHAHDTHSRNWSVHHHFVSNLLHHRQVVGDEQTGEPILTLQPL